jgi:hypothetical protein
LPARQSLEVGWLLAERAARNDIPDNGPPAFRNLIAFFSQRTP